jgi:hypothetical protein
MTSYENYRLVLAAGAVGLVLVAIPAGPAVADDPAGAAVLRAESQAIGQAIGTQVRSGTGQAVPGQPADAYDTPYGSEPLPVLATGPQTVRDPQGAALHAGPAPGTPILVRLTVGTPVVVTRPVGASGWVEVTSAGIPGYLWAPQLTTGGEPPAPSTPER